MHFQNPLLVPNGAPANGRTPAAHITFERRGGAPTLGGMRYPGLELQLQLSVGCKGEIRS